VANVLTALSINNPMAENGNFIVLASDSKKFCENY
jgi:hypothetical protein